MYQTNHSVSGGVVHALPPDLHTALSSNNAALLAWEDITPLARNEWICWSVSVKQQKTRDEHINRVVSELTQGIRRPCCWLGCVHRKDKPISPSVAAMLARRTKD